MNNIETNKIINNVSSYYMDIISYLIKLSLFGFAILAIYFLFNNKRETFIPISIYPKIFDTPILSDTYPLYKPVGLKGNRRTKPETRSYSPVWTSGSYEQKTNNIRDWNSPCVGTGISKKICDDLYEEKEISQYCLIPEPIKGCRRVNYYCSSR